MEIIKKPIITEKAMKLGEKSQYVFEVDRHANKIEIKKKIKEIFEVDVKSIRTATVKGKVKSRFTRKGVQRGRTATKKKAYITLKEGQTIDLVSSVSS